MSNPDRFIELLVWQLRIENLVAVLDEVCRFDAARDRLPTVEVENFHGVIVAWPAGTTDYVRRKMNEEEVGHGS